MAGRRGGRRGNNATDEWKEEKDAEIEALRRQVEQLTMLLERQTARHGHGGSSNSQSSTDDESDVNPFANNRRRLHRSFDHIKIDLPEFHGRLQPEEFLEWLSAIEKFFDYKETPQNQRVKLVATRLRGYASTRWDKVQEIKILNCYAPSEFQAYLLGQMIRATSL